MKTREEMISEIVGEFDEKYCESDHKADDCEFRADLCSALLRISDASTKSEREQTEKTEAGRFIKYLQRQRGLIQSVPIKERMGLIEAVEQMGKDIANWEHHKDSPSQQKRTLFVK